jgi:uncharacterized protein
MRAGPAVPGHDVGDGAPAQLRSRRNRTWLIVAVLIVAAVIAVVGYAYGETFRLQVKEYAFTSRDVPSAFDGTRIVLLTDVHRTWFFSQERVGRLVDRVGRLEPDLIVLGGDYVYRTTEYEASAFEELGRLHAPLGTFAVLGNHDYGEHDSDGEDVGPALRAVAATNVALLDNRAVWIEKAGQRIRLGGVGDYTQDAPQFGPTINDTEAGDMVLLVSHNPDVSEGLPVGAVDLVLSGHTHGGQLTFFGLFAFHVPSDYGQKYRTGEISNGRTTVIVSNGVGTIFPPVRFFAPPQIVVITLKTAS